MDPLTRFYHEDMKLMVAFTQIDYRVPQRGEYYLARNLHVIRCAAAPSSKYARRRPILKQSCPVEGNDFEWRAK